MPTAALFAYRRNWLATIVTKARSLRSVPFVFSTGHSSTTLRETFCDETVSQFEAASTTASFEPLDGPATANAAAPGLSATGALRGTGPDLHCPGRELRCDFKPTWTGTSYCKRRSASLRSPKRTSWWRDGRPSVPDVNRCA